jgi:hypothetical protein
VKSIFEKIEKEACYQNKQERKDAEPPFEAKSKATAFLFFCHGKRLLYAGSAAGGIERMVQAESRPSALEATGFVKKAGCHTSSCCTDKNKISVKDTSNFCAAAATHGRGGALFSKGLPPNYPQS